MRLSTRARYALRLMLDIAKNGGETEPVSLASAAARTELSKGYLEQLVYSLRTADLVRGVMGMKGGYLLTRPAETITLRAIIEASIGPIDILDCLESPEACMRADTCECRVVYMLVNRRITEVLEEFSLADLMNPGLLESVREELVSIPPPHVGRKG